MLAQFYFVIISLCALCPLWLNKKINSVAKDKDAGNVFEFGVKDK
jgi:hypothetical protein